MTGNELREKYLRFFEERGHKVVPSSPMVPENDPTTLFTGSGMQPMLPYLLGEAHPEGKRIVDSQRCFRVQDVEEVGDNRHQTAFEMLGNWSLGDYFKREQLSWFWEFLTKEVGIDPHKLYVTVFAGGDGIGRDDEAIGIWQELFESAGIEAKVVEGAAERGMQGGRIFAYPAKKNWWSRSGTPDKMPAGEPGGPDSEVFYEFEQVGHDPKFGEYCHVNCDCGRFLEIGNSVFMQYQKQLDGSFKELPQKNIDFGGGLERILAAKENAPDVFKTDLFWPVIERVQELSGKEYETDTTAFRIIADHLKAATWLMSDGVVPSNKAQGYVLRRVIRRAVRFGQELGIEQGLTEAVAQTVIAMYRHAYPQMVEQREMILSYAREEETKFLRTLTRGVAELKKHIEKYYEQAPIMEEVAQRAFDFYQTYGLPVDVFLDELMKRFPDSYSIDERQEIQQLAEEHFAKHQEQSRTASAGMFKGGLGSTGEKEIQYHTATHLLQQALRDVLGDGVVQRGSNITAERLRFDFTSERRLTPEEKAQVENIVNEKIGEKLPVSYVMLAAAEAEKVGAIHAFGEKYGDVVKVYSVGRLPEGVEARSQTEDGLDLALAAEVSGYSPREVVYSREYCGGPHVANTGLIEGRFVIEKDEKIARDVVRIKAVLK